jgi:preprotein translocase subunit YajC
MNFYGLILQQQSPQQGGSPYFLIMMGICFAIFYFIVMVPMRRQKKQQAQLLRELKAGDEILTSSGIIGTIVTTSDDRLVVRVKPDNVKLQISRNSVAGLVPEEKKS